MGISDKREVKKAFQYPLFEAISRRRTRRFPMGARIEMGMRQHVSKCAPLPLNDVETAMLCWAGAGVTGCIAGDLPTPAAAQGTSFGTWLGRAVPTACNVQSTRLFFTNDDGTFLYDPKTATKTVEIDSESDRENIMAQFREGCTKLFDGRAEFKPEGGYAMGQWNLGKQGTTVFMPIVDQTEEYLNTLLILFESAGHLIDDDPKKGDPATLLNKWIGRIPSLEFNALMLNTYPVGAMLQNISLAAEAIGLGTVVFAGYSGIMMLGVTSSTKGLGFRSTTTKSGEVNPVGLDGRLEPFCPPYYRNMGDAVDAFVSKKFGRCGTFDADYAGPSPFSGGKSVLGKYERPSERTIKTVKDYCNHVYDMYGRFPGTSDTILLKTWLQVHHLDLEFYDKYMSEGIVNQTHRKHMDTWHRDT